MRSRLLIVLAALLCVAAANPPPPPPPSVKTTFKVAAGDAFPAFELRNGKGKIVSQADLKGRYTLVNFFFAACAPCIAEIPALNAFASKNPRTRVLAVTFDEAAKASAFAARWDFRWPIVPGGRVLFDSVGVVHVPAFVLVDPKGRVVATARSREIAAPMRFVDEPSLTRWVAAKKTGK